MARTSNESKAFGKLLRKARDDVGLTTEQLSRQLYCARETVDRWMRGERRPNRDVVVRWEELCGIAPGTLVGPYNDLPPFGTHTARELVGVAEPSSLAAAQRPAPLAFLCHSSADKPYVRRLAGRLRRDEIRTWLDERDIAPGREWEPAIRAAVRAADVVIVCLSRGSTNQAGYVQKEIRLVLDVADEQPEGAIYVIPAKIEPCEVPDRLGRWQWVDLRKRGGYNRLLASVRQAGARRR